MSLLIRQFPYLNSADLFSEVAEDEWAQFLDSGVIKHRFPVTKHADFDVLVANPIATLVTSDSVTVIENYCSVVQSSADPLELLKRQLAPLEREFIDCQLDIDEIPAYVPGAVGYFSYDLARRFENIPSIAKNTEQLPQMAMGVYSVVVVVDHRAEITSLVSLGETEKTIESENAWVERINRVLATDSNSDTSNIQLHRASTLQENIDWQSYNAKFNAIRDYTVEGDCYQVNFAKQFSCHFNASAWDTYKNLRHLSPAPYAAYQNFPFAQVLSNSPESFMSCRGAKVTTSPIKGTRPRDHTDAENDHRIAEQLKQSLKDRAENLMIVDLMRNDLSRCCELGSVAVPSLFALHSFANVHHLISTVTGVLRSDMHVLDLIRHSFPGGSITGAPKIRAMEIIEELEPDRRGLYCGSIGYIGVDSSLETNIAIRTIVLKDGIARFSAGGGLVIDSNAEDEYQEIVDKASMMKRVLVKD